jgi:two-component system OmpR family sensor kinase
VALPKAGRDGSDHASVVVAAHGGRVEVRSAPGRGATFQVLLPAIDQ